MGPVDIVPLAEAREKARKHRRQLLDGLDPIEEKRSKRQDILATQARGMTFQECAEAFIAAHERGWKNEKHRWQWGQTLHAHAFPVFGKLHVAAVDTMLVMKAVEPLWLTKAETASRLRGRIERILDWATARGYRKGDNPARWKGHLDKLLPARSKVQKVKHHPAMPWRDMPDFMGELRSNGSVSASAMTFTILTAARTSEAINARWNEIDVENRVWTVPAERMKTGVQHRVPLCEAIIKLLAELPRLDDEGFVFPGGKKDRLLSNMAMLVLLRGMRPNSGLTVHGFRSAFRDWAGEATNHPREVCEQALAHTISNQVEAAYRRGDFFEKRRSLMQDWADYLASGG